MINNKRIKNFLCEWYQVNENSDITMGTFLAQSAMYGTFIVIVLALFVSLVTLVGMYTQSCITGYDLMQPYGGNELFPKWVGVITFLFGLATIAVIALIGVVIMKISSIKLAHCNVKDKKGTKEEQRRYNNQHKKTEMENKQIHPEKR